MTRLTSMMLAAVVACGLLLGLPGTAHAAIQKRGNLKVMVTHVQRGELVTVRGWVPPRHSRTVVLQRKVSWGWATVARGKTTDRRGAFKLQWTPDLAPQKVKLRVLAPRRKIGGKVYHMLKTPTRRLVVDPGPQPAVGDMSQVTMGNNTSDRISLSGDGRWATFDSLAKDLVATTTEDDPYQDVYLEDRSTGDTLRITNGRGTSTAADISADGRYVLFDSFASSLVLGDTNQNSDVFVYDADTHELERLTDGDRGSYAAGISDDGRYVVLYSFATNLVPDDTNGSRDVFLYDRDTDTIKRLTNGSSSAFDPAISADGQWVSFYSGASNLVAGDTNRNRDVFLYEVATGTTTRITDGNGASSSSRKALSADGRYLTFWSEASNLVGNDTNAVQDVFVYDRVAGTTTRITDGNNHSSLPAISDDGQHVAFESYATNLAPGTDKNDQLDAFVYDVATGITTRLGGATGATFHASLSADGGVVGFTSSASDLAAGDTNDLADVFVWVRRPVAG
ncbi:TolB family protein [Nocardioides sp.]|uniref:TolB family protein n=1 Tax=Nocardioides sp. TaxID=35761 RepID=UPI003528FD19